MPVTKIREIAGTDKQSWNCFNSNIFKERQQMFKGKGKAYIISIAACLLGTLTTGVDYIVFDVKIAGIVFFFAVCASILNVFAYIKDNENSNIKK